MSDGPNAIQVTDERYARHLGYPDGRIREGDSGRLAERARRWFGQHAAVWSVERALAIQALGDDCIRLEDGTELHSATLAARFREAGCHAVYVLAISAGEGVDAAIKAHWEADRPDEAYALNAFTAAYIEERMEVEGFRLCEAVDGEGQMLLPHYCPGYDGWDVSENGVLARALDAPGLQVLPSGQLLPQKSMLAVFGITAHPERVPSGQIPCVGCSLLDCRLRRAPFSEPHPGTDEANPAPAAPVMSGYAFPEKALRRWSTKQTELEQGGDQIRARFHFLGSTCSDGGIPLKFVYEVSLVPEGDEHIIRHMCAAPAENHTGYRSMCSYQSSAEEILHLLQAAHPLLGRPLSDALNWNPDRNPAGCICSVENRNHKWLMALQTIHFSLVARQEGA